MSQELVALVVFIVGALIIIGIRKNLPILSWWAETLSRVRRPTEPATEPSTTDTGLKIGESILVIAGLIAVMIAVVNYDLLRDLVIPPATPVQREFVLPWQSPYLTGLDGRFGFGHLVVIFSVLFAAFVVMRYFLKAANTLAGAAGPRKAITTDMVIAIAAVAIIYYFIAILAPHFTNAVVAQVSMFGVIVFTIMFMFVVGLTKGPLRITLGGVMAIIALWVVWPSIWRCAPNDTVCITTQHTANRAAAAKAAAERERRKEQMLHEEQRARRVARNPQCPGEKIVKAIVIPEGTWIRLPSRPGTCDFTISDIPKLEFTHNSSMIEISADRGLLSTSIPTHARAKYGVGTVVADYMLCPQGMSPDDGSWECRSYSPSVPYGLFNAVFGKH